MAHYHPTEEWLAAYASGAIDEATSVLIATHLTYCAECRRAVEDLEAVGGALLESINIDDLAASSVSELNSAESIAETLRGHDVQETTAAGSLADIAPRPLVSYVIDKLGVADLNALPWKFYGPGIERAVLLEGPHGVVARLLRARPGAAFPHHGHGSDELTVVLTGAYRDATGRYGVGDVQCISEDVKHQPVIEDDGECIAFVVSEKPTIPTGLVARLVQRLIGA